MRIDEFILEVFNFRDEKNRYQYKITRPAKQIIQATVEDETVVLDIVIKIIQKNLWYIYFSRNGSFSITGEGDEYKVFNTVFHFLGQQLQNYRPKYLFFIATEPSRIKLYNSFIRRMIPKFLPDYIKIDNNIDLGKNLLLPKTLKRGDHQFVIKRRI